MSHKFSIKKLINMGQACVCLFIFYLIYLYLSVLFLFFWRLYTLPCKSEKSILLIFPNIFQTYNWDNQSVVLSAFFWGYVILQLPAAQLGKKFGAKWLLVCCTTVDSLACLSIPTSAEYFGATGVMICRFLQGLAQGCISPLLHTLLGYWAPPCERSVIGTFSYAGE